MTGIPATEWPALRESFRQWMAEDMPEGTLREWERLAVVSWDDDE